MPNIHHPEKRREGKARCTQQFCKLSRAQTRGGKKKIQQSADLHRFFYKMRFTTAMHPAFLFWWCSQEASLWSTTNLHGSSQSSAAPKHFFLSRRTTSIWKPLNTCSPTKHSHCVLNWEESLSSAAQSGRKFLQEVLNSLDCRCF